MKLTNFILLAVLFFSCRGTKVSDQLCSEWEYLKYPVIAKGYIGTDATPQGEICYQRKWMSYTGLSKKCIIELLGEPARIEKNEFVYYFSSNPKSGQGAIGVLHVYFHNGKMKRIRCSLS